MVRDGFEESMRDATKFQLGEPIRCPVLPHLFPLGNDNLGAPATGYDRGV